MNQGALCSTFQKFFEIKVDHNAVARGNVGFEACWLGQAGLIGEELQSPSVVRGREPFQEQAAEQS